MQYQRTYFDKCATIVEGSNLNTGFNPVSDLLYGRNRSRLLVHFNHGKIKGMVDDKTFPDISRLRHTIKMTNASSLDKSELYKTYASQVDCGEKKRTSSFDLILFLVPQDWDGGKGFSYSDTMTDKIVPVSSDGVTWYKPSNGKRWHTEKPFRKTTDGQFTFYLKSDSDTVCSNGGKVTFTYSCCCNNVFANKNLVFKSVVNSEDRPVSIGKPVFFSKSGMVCSDEADIIKYGEYAKVEVEFPASEGTTGWKYVFRCEYDVDGTVYKSNPYTITEIKGNCNIPEVDTSDGIYSTKVLQEQLNLYRNGNESIVVGMQHFDIGCEDLSIDITDTMNRFITGELENHGLCIAFTPALEEMECSIENYAGFFTNRTNSFFEPYVETIYTDSVSDDRDNFVLGKENRLYLYSNIGGKLENLDNIPTCTVNGEELEVKQGGKGMYYVNLTLQETAFTSPTMLYDTWDGITYHGVDFKPVELDFTAKPASSFFNIGSSVEEAQKFTVTTYGISDSEKIKRGDIRKVGFIFKKDYSKNIALRIDYVEARMYVKDGTAQVEVMPYIRTERTATDTYIMIDTSTMLPGIYHMDVKAAHGMEMIEHRDILSFEIVGEENNKYV